MSLSDEGQLMQDMKVLGQSSDSDPGLVEEKDYLKFTHDRLISDSIGYMDPSRRHGHIQR